ncbi:MAG: radical SAM protein [Candidatus Kariarchaeaceae archaeon]
MQILWKSFLNSKNINLQACGISIQIGLIAGFNQLEIWDDPKVSENLKWYTQVADNEMPAKYLIARRIPIKESYKEIEEDELWEEHYKATEEFLKLKDRIQNHSQRLGDLPVAKPNLMDLNVELVNRMLRHCQFCRWNCKVDRVSATQSGTKTGTCQLGEESRISSYFHHRGEEIIFRGTVGSGTIFFTSCTMRCKFCQNGDISKDKENGLPFTAKSLSLIIWLLRMEGCHNINFVGGDPTMHLHTVVEAISELTFFEPSSSDLQEIMRIKSDRFMNYPLNKNYADYQGEFNSPMLWNSNFFISEKAMRILRTVIDIWLPDFKFGNNTCSRRLARTPWYFETVAQNHQTIHDWGESFSIRHLIMPNHNECCTFPILDWMKANIPNALINIMTQYHPDCYVTEDPKLADINRRPTSQEFQEAFVYAQKLGLNFEALTFEKFR